MKKRKGRYYLKKPYNPIKRRGTANPLYRKWRLHVMRRDGNKCQDCGNRRRRELQVHHIKKWADYVSLRYSVANGITLCRTCHKKAWGREEERAARYYRLIEQNLLRKLRKESNEETQTMDQQPNPDSEAHNI